MQQLLEVHDLGLLLDAGQPDLRQLDGHLAAGDHDGEAVVAGVGLDDLVELRGVVVELVGLLVVVALLVDELEDERAPAPAQLLGLVDDERAAAGLVAVVLVLLEVGGHVVLRSLPGLVLVVALGVAVRRHLEPVVLQHAARAVVAAEHEEAVAEDVPDGAHLDGERVHQHVLEGEQLVRLQELALQHARVVLLLLDDLPLVFVQPLDDAERAFACLLLLGLLDLLVQLAVEDQSRVGEVFRQLEFRFHQFFFVFDHSFQ